MEAVLLVEFAGQAYPGEQGPLQAAVVSPVALPKVPAGQTPLQTAVGSPVEFPKVPTGHAVHATAPLRLYLPRAHATPKAEAVAQANPGRHGPVQAEEFRPLALPYSPCGHEAHAPTPGGA